MRPVASPDPARAAAGARGPMPCGHEGEAAFRTPQLGKYNDMARCACSAGARRGRRRLAFGARDPHHQTVVVEGRCERVGPIFKSGR